MWEQCSILEETSHEEKPLRRMRNKWSYFLFAIENPPPRKNISLKQGEDIIFTKEGDVYK